MKKYLVLPISKNNKSGGLFVIHEYFEILGINIRNINSIEKLSLLKVFYFYLFKRKYKNRFKIYILSPIGLFLIFFIKRFSNNIYYFSQADDSIIMASLLKDKFKILSYPILKKYLRNFLPFLMNKNLKKIFTNSKFVALLNKNYSSNSRIFILNLWTKEEHYKIGKKIIQKRLNIKYLSPKNDPIKIGFMARYNYWKGFRHFDFLYKNLISLGNVEFIVQNSNDISIKNLTFNLIRDVSEFYSNIDIYICTSDIEGFCLPIFEALLYGSLIVTTYQPAAIEYIPSEFINNGFFMCKKMEKENESVLASDLLREIKNALKFRKDLTKYKKFLLRTLEWNKEKFLLYRKPMKNEV